MDESRRKFITQASILLGSVGLAADHRMDLVNKLAKKLIPEAQAAESVAPRRMLEISLRWGLPLIMFGTGKEFTELSQPRYANSAYAKNQYIQTATSLFLNRDSASLAPHASNIAITQGVKNETGHTDLFANRRGGSINKATSPIILLTNKNPSKSLVHGLKWSYGTANQLNGMNDLTPVSLQSFVSLFKQPTLELTPAQINSVAEAAKSMSRQQALLFERTLYEAVIVSENQGKVVKLFSSDYSEQLDISGMSSTLISGPLANEGRALAYSLKAFEHNLINSSLVTINLHDWHGKQQPGDVGPSAKAISEKLAETISYMKRTKDPAASNGETLWETTTIVMSSEFNRGLSPFGQDNSDGGTQGLFLAGHNIKGGYYGGFKLNDSATTQEGVAYGFDIKTGQKLPGKQNLNSQSYHTVMHLAKNIGANPDEVFQCMING